MGCLFSHEADDRDHGYYVPSARSTIPESQRGLAPSYPCFLRDYRSQAKPLYGEFKCVCGRKWNSILSWRGGYQICKRCKTQVYPMSQREVLPSDTTRDEVGEHPKEFCQKCRQLGYFCGRSRRLVTSGRSYKRY